MKATLEVWGYQAMLILLRARVERDGSSTVRDVLEEFSTGRNGSPTEAIREEWNAAVRDAMASTPDQVTQLHLS